MIEDFTIISIEQIAETKHIHFLGSAYFSGDSSDKPYRYNEYTSLMCELNEAIKYGVEKWESDNQDSVGQYISELTEEEFYGLRRYKTITYEEITNDLPCGEYCCVVK